MNYDPYECQMDPSTPMSLEIMPPPSVGPAPPSAPTPSSQMYGNEQTSGYAPVKAPMSNQWVQQQQQQPQQAPPQQAGSEYRFDSGFNSSYQISPYDNPEEIVDPYDSPNLYACGDVNLASSQNMSYDHTPNVYMSESCQMSNQMSNQLSNQMSNQLSNQLSANQLSSHQISTGQMTPGGAMSNWQPEPNMMNKQQGPMFSQGQQAGPQSQQHLYNSNVYEASMMPASGHQSAGHLSAGAITPGGPLGPQGLVEMTKGASPHSIKLEEFDVNYQQQSNNLELSSANFDGPTWIPELTRLLQDEDPVVVSQTASIVMHFSQREKNRQQLTNTPELIRALIGPNILASNDTDLENSVATVLYNLSNNMAGLRLLIEVNGVQAIIKLLNSSVKNVVLKTIPTLHNLLLNINQEAKAAVYQCPNALSFLVKLLDGDNDKFLAVVTDCIQLLCYGNSSAKLEVFKHQGALKLIHIMNTHNYEKLLWTTSKALKVLSVCSSNKPFIVQRAGLQALAKHLDLSKSKRLVLNCLWTMRNLSDAAVRCEKLEPLLEILVKLLGHDDRNIVTCVAGILANLTCNNQNNKLTVYQLGGIEALFMMLARHGTSEPDLTDPAICALRHLTSRHAQSEKAQNDVRAHQGLPVIVGLLDPSRGWSLIKATIGVLRNVALAADNHRELREHGAISSLMFWMDRACQRLEAAYAAGHVNGPVREDDVRLDEIVELSIGSLQTLAKDPANRAEIRRMPPAFVKFVQLLRHNSLPIKRVTVGLLCELASDREGARMIQNSNAMPVLNELVNLKLPEPVSAHAHELLSKLVNLNGNYAHLSYDNRQQQQTMTTMTSMMSNVGLARPGGGPSLQQHGNMLPQFSTAFGPPSVASIIEEMDTFDHSF